jgi:hypothetical protein
LFYDSIRLMRKKITVFVFLLAIITILAHQIIPHHHHNDHICFELSFLSESNQVHGNHNLCVASCSPDHRHDEPESTTCHVEFPASFNDPCAKLPDQDHDTSGCCLLTEMLVYKPQSQREELICPVNYLKYQELPSVYLSDSEVQQGFVLYAAAWPFRQTPCTLHYSPQNAIQTPGLRAPPIC